MSHKISSFKDSCNAIRQFEAKNKLKLTNYSWAGKKVVMRFNGNYFETSMISLKESSGKAADAIYHLCNFYSENRNKLNQATKKSIEFSAREILAGSDCKWGCKFWKTSPAQTAFNQFTKTINGNDYRSQNYLELN